jgi:VanZ family protein
MEAVLDMAERYARHFLAAFLCLILVLTLWPFTFFSENGVMTLPGGGVQFTPPAILYVDSLPSSIRHMRRFTILFRYTPGSAVPASTCTMFASAANSGEQNFSLTQSGTALIFRMPTSDRHGLVIENAVRRGEKIWCGIEYDGDALRAYVDGEKRVERKVGRLDVSGWNCSYPLVIGSEPNGYFGWIGTLYALAIFDESLPPFSFRDPELLIRVHPPVLLFRFRPQETNRFVSTGRDSVTAFLAPRPFAPARRTFLIESPTTFFRQRIFDRDVVANIILFLPLGYFFAAIVSPKRHRIFFTSICAAGAGCALSLIIEILQAYLPGRYSSLSDVLSNTAGAIFGVFLFHSRHWLHALLQDRKPSTFPDE